MDQGQYCYFRNWAIYSSYKFILGNQSKGISNYFDWA